MLVTPVRSTYDPISRNQPPSQMATNYTTLNIHARSRRRMGGFGEIYITMCHRQSATDNTLKTFSWEKKNFYSQHSRSTWKIKFASHVCRQKNNPTAYTTLKAQQKTRFESDTSLWCLGWMKNCVCVLVQEFFMRSSGRSEMETFWVEVEGERERERLPCWSSLKLL
jgi:hypothetical protein